MSWFAGEGLEEINRKNGFSKIKWVSALISCRFISKQAKATEEIDHQAE